MASDIEDSKVEQGLLCKYSIQWFFFGFSFVYIPIYKGRKDIKDIYNIHTYRHEEEKKRGKSGQKETKKTGVIKKGGLRGSLTSSASRFLEKEKGIKKRENLKEKKTHAIKHVREKNH